ncbi:PvsTP1, truncated, putative [Treponema pallidum subsp. pallidum str. Chicago]|nr:PvsTP1, truncated, putative [Treponema pallidum subsp. pallidum str. Chicago]
MEQDRPLCDISPSNHVIPLLSPSKRLARPAGAQYTAQVYFLKGLEWRH